MTERTFRSPSPYRPTSSGSAHRQSQSLGHAASEEMPPVPALPRQPEIMTEQVRPHRRAISSGVSATPLRLASQSLGSEDAPAWFGASKLGDPRNVRHTDPAMASPPSSPPQAARGEQKVEVARPSSRTSSINFSYPTRGRVGSSVSPVDTSNSAETWSKAAPDLRQAQPSQPSRPVKPLSKKRHSTPGASYDPAFKPSDQVLVYDPNSRRMVPQANLRAVEQAVRGVSEQPTGSKRKKQTPQRTGSYLAKGTMGRNKFNVLATEPEKNLQVGKAAPEILNSTLPRPTQVKNSEKFDEPGATINPSRIDTQKQEKHRTADDSTSQPHLSDVAPAGVSVMASSFWELPQQTVKRQPSVVEEEPELETETDKEHSIIISEALDAVPARQRVGTGTGSRTHMGTQEVGEAVPFLDAPVALSPPPTFQETEASSGTSQPTDAAAKETAQQALFEFPRPSRAHQERATSNSPVRQAHFGSVSNNLTVRHSPPPRSVSPRKSALKHSSSPCRGASPSDDTSEASGGVNSREDPPVPRKKSVRVSFDDGNTAVVGESSSPNRSDSPVLASPQNAARRPWYSSIGRKKDLPPLDDDEIMKPRPALPSFGSVRDRKPRELVQDEGERPLIRPIAERLHGLITPKFSETPADDDTLDQHNADLAVGAKLAREQEERSKIPANTSRYREPLPPVVTSVEGSGYISDTSTSSSSGSETQQVAEEDTKEPYHSPPVESLALDEKQGLNGSTRIETAVPTISISQPTPPIVEKKSSESSFFLDVPGGFPEDDSDLSAPEGSRGATLVALESKEPTSTPPAASQSITSPTAETSSDSESSIYSDAYEDLSETEGDGFQSLDAVLGAPVATQTTANTISQENTPQPSSTIHDYIKPEIQAPTSSTAGAPQSLQSEISTEPAEPQDEWEKVKAYWRSLTADKRAQLEQEATEDAGVEGDLEGIKVVQKPKKKKSVERRTSERKALAVHMAQQMVAQQQKRAESQPVERSYMIQPGTRWVEEDMVRSSMPTTLRGHPPKQSAVTSGDAPRLRKSMRPSSSGVDGGSAQPNRTRQLDARPVSMAAQPSTVKHQSMSKQSLQRSQQPLLLKRRGSTSSESSFKRTRPGTAAHVSGFRTSMRHASPPVAQFDKPTDKPTGKRFSLRSLSPPSSAFKRNADGPPVSMPIGSNMRQTLRDSSSERKKSPSGLRIPGFGSKKAGNRASGSQFSSRFGDSSDEDGDGGKSGFRSRFEDSSGDEAVSPIVLPKAMPRSLRNQDSIASTALPEELEESEELPDRSIVTNTQQQRSQNHASSAVPQSPSTNLRLARSGSGRLATSQTAPAVMTVGTTKVMGRPASVASKRSSIMTALRRKKHDSSGKISRPAITESAARRDTKLERNLSQLRGIRSDGSEVEAEAEAEERVAGEEKAVPTPRSPKLQKRVVSLARSIGSTDNNAVAGAELPSPLALAASPEAEVASAGLHDREFIHTPPQRPSTKSGNLGTRTLSGLSGIGAGSSTQPGFLQRRTVSAGVMSLDAPSVAGTASVAGTTSTKKKKFGTLRRLFGLAE